MLTRRGAESLRLSKESTSALEREMVAALSRLITVTLNDGPARLRLTDSLRESFPWVQFLDRSATDAFVADFLRTARACASVGRFERLGIEVANWKETATAYSVGLNSRPAELDYLPDVVEADDPRTA